MQSLYLYLLAAPFFLGWYFIHWLITNDQGPKEPPKILFLAGVFGTLAFPVAVILEEFFTSSKLTTSPHSLSFESLLLNCLLVGLIEEGLKGIPLAIFIYKKGYFNEVTDGIIYFGISGMVFGAIEDIGYTLSLGIGAGITKVVTGPFSHAGFTSIFGWTLARRKVLRTPWWTVGAGFAGAVAVHGIYDFGLFYGRIWTVLISLAITIVVNVGVFRLFRRAQKIDKEIGLSAQNVSNFCIWCGYPNPTHLLFCVNCGRKA